MKRGKELEDLIEDVEVYIPSLVANKNDYEDVSKHLNEHHGVNRSVLAKVLNNPKQLEAYGDIFTGLIAQQLAVKNQSASQDLRLEEWFTEVEIENIKNYKHASEVENDEISFPLTLQNVDMLKTNAYQVAMEETMIARLRKYYLLKYNFDLQRDPILVKRGGKTRKKMNLNKKNIREIEELVLEGKLMPTAMVYNCTPYTGVGAQELIYDEKTRELTINEGTVMNILDGTHRTFGIYGAYKKNRNLINKIPVIITNYTDDEAKQFQVQLSKQTPINKTRISQLESPTLASHIVNSLNSSHIFKDMVATNMSRPKDSYFVHYEDFTLGFTILWKAETMLDVKSITSNFTDYLMYLLDYHTKHGKKEDYLTDSKLFVGHIALAKKMKENNVAYDDLPSILAKVDWSDANKQLVNLKEEMIKSKSSKRAIYNVGKYFENLI